MIYNFNNYFFYKIKNESEIIFIFLIFFQIYTLMKREEEIIELRTKLIKLIRKISKTIGFYWWRRYISCSFWKNIEIPINLSLTIFSTIISAQASTNNFIKQEHYVVLSFASVLLTTFNTYFRPLQKYNTNTKTILLCLL